MKPTKKARLTSPEREWLDRLQSVLSDAPSDRLGFYTVGDCDVFVYDKSRDKEITKYSDKIDGADFCICVDVAGGGVMASLKFPSNVHSTRG